MDNDWKDAIEMMGKGYEEPAAILESPRRRHIMGKLPGLDEQDTSAWVKLSTAFKPHIKNLKGAPLSVWLYISLSINRNGIAFPGIRTMADELGYSHQGILDAIATLEEKGYLKVTRGERRYNLYQPEFAANGKGNEPVNSVDSSDNESTFSPNESTFSPNESSALDSNKKNKNQQDIETVVKKANKTVDAILETERKAKGKQYTQLPEIFIPYARAFADATGIQPSKRDLMEWLSVIQDWMNAGYQPSDITEAVRDIIAEGKISIARPASITFKLRSLAMAKRAEPHYYQPAPIVETGPAVPPPHRVIV